MASEESVPTDNEIERWVKVARLVHDKCPADHAGDHWPIGNIAMQYRLLEQQEAFQRKILEEQERKHREIIERQDESHKELVKTQQTQHKDMLDRQDKSIHVNWVLVAVTLFTALAANFLTWKSNQHTVRLTAAERRPQIDVTPVRIQQDSGTNTAVYFSVANYSGFSAYDISIDVMYGIPNSSWTGEWVKARREAEAGRKGVVKTHIYSTASPTLLPGELKPGDGLRTETPNVFALDLRSDVCGSKHRKIPVHVRTRWRGQDDHYFDQLQNYDLICTTDREGSDTGNGRSFTFLPTNTRRFERPGR